MDPNSHKMEIIHREGCRCVVLGEAIYVSSTCVTRGWVRLSRARIQQLIHAMKVKDSE